MTARRIIPCLDVRDGRVVKGTQFRNHRDLGEPLELAQRYCADGADELVFYDISASPAGRSVETAWIQRISDHIDIPFAVAGGISSLATAIDVLDAGADKISINTPALRNPNLIDQIAKHCGSQCVVIGVDSLYNGDHYEIYQNTGDEAAISRANRRTADWVREVQQRGAGEIVLNCMASDGVRDGYDVEQCLLIREVCEIPLVASGGAGRIEHFSEVFVRADVDAALAASVFHLGSLTPNDIKRELLKSGLEMRL